MTGLSSRFSEPASGVYCSHARLGARNDPWLRHSALRADVSSKPVISSPGVPAAARSGEKQQRFGPSTARNSSPLSLQQEARVGRSVTRQSVEDLIKGISREPSVVRSANFRSVSRFTDLDISRSATERSFTRATQPLKLRPDVSIYRRLKVKLESEDSENIPLVVNSGVEENSFKLLVSASVGKDSQVTSPQVQSPQTERVVVGVVMEQADSALAPALQESSFHTHQVHKKATHLLVPSDQAVAAVTAPSCEVFFPQEVEQTSISLGACLPEAAHAANGWSVELPAGSSFSASVSAACYQAIEQSVGGVGLQLSVPADAAVSCVTGVASVSSSSQADVDLMDLEIHSSVAVESGRRPQQSLENWLAIDAADSGHSAAPGYSVTRNTQLASTCVSGDRTLQQMIVGTTPALRLGSGARVDGGHEISARLCIDGSSSSDLSPAPGSLSGADRVPPPALLSNAVTNGQTAVVPDLCRESGDAVFASLSGGPSVESGGCVHHAETLSVSEDPGDKSLARSEGLFVEEDRIVRETAAPGLFYGEVGFNGSAGRSPENLDLWLGLKSRAGLSVQSAGYAAAAAPGAASVAASAALAGHEHAHVSSLGSSESFAVTVDFCDNDACVSGDVAASVDVPSGTSSLGLELTVSSGEWPMFTPPRLSRSVDVEQQGCFVSSDGNAEVPKTPVRIRVRKSEEEFSRALSPSGEEEAFKPRHTPEPARSPGSDLIGRHSLNRAQLTPTGSVELGFGELSESLTPGVRAPSLMVGGAPDLAVVAVEEEAVMTEVNHLVQSLLARLRVEKGYSDLLDLGYTVYMRADHPYFEFFQNTDHVVWNQVLYVPGGTEAAGSDETVRSLPGDYGFFLYSSQFSTLMYGGRMYVDFIVDGKANLEAIMKYHPRWDAVQVRDKLFSPLSPGQTAEGGLGRFSVCAMVSPDEIVYCGCRYLRSPADLEKAWLNERMTKRVSGILLNCAAPSWVSPSQAKEVKYMLHWKSRYPDFEWFAETDHVTWRGAAFLPPNADAATAIERELELLSGDDEFFFFSVAIGWMVYSGRVYELVTPVRQAKFFDTSRVEIPVDGLLKLDKVLYFALGVDAEGGLGKLRMNLVVERMEEVVYGGMRFGKYTGWDVPRHAHECVLRTH